MNEEEEDAKLNKIRKQQVKEDIENVALIKRYEEYLSLKVKKDDSGNADTDTLIASPHSDLSRRISQWRLVYLLVSYLLLY